MPSLTPGWTLIHWPSLLARPQILNVTIALVDRRDATIGMAENSTSELFALVSEALRQAGRNFAPQIAGRGLLRELAPGDFQKGVGSQAAEILGHTLDRYVLLRSLGRRCRRFKACHPDQ